MAEIYTVFAVFIGFPLLFIGWIWSVVVAKKSGTKWMLAMIFPSFVLALPAYALIYWQRIKWPFAITTVGILLLLGTLLLVP